LSDGVDNWLVVGSRRWARIVAEELCAVAGPGPVIQLQGSRSDAALLEWAEAKGIEVVGQPRPSDGSGVALIVNSAHEHRDSVENVLDLGYHAVCEKPLTFSRVETLELLAHADARGLKLFSTNTYLFAEYLHVLRRDRLRDGLFSELELMWADASAEVRHGEAKSYDSGVPVFADVLPHVACIVLATHGSFAFHRSSIAVAEGGSAVIAQYDGDELTVRASIARNAPRRVRLLRLSGPAGRVELDFAVEPGVVDGVAVDPAWASRRRPIAQMLHSVKAYFEGGELDDRLGPEAALLGNDLIDAVADSYVQRQIDFLEAPAGGEDLAYATKEAEAIRERAQLDDTAPLRRLAMFTQTSRTLS
jgi:predicted dehydrogenase